MSNRIQEPEIKTNNGNLKPYIEEDQDLYIPYVDTIGDGVTRPIGHGEQDVKEAFKKIIHAVAKYVGTIEEINNPCNTELIPKDQEEIILQQMNINCILKVNGN